MFFCGRKGVGGVKALIYYGPGDIRMEERDKPTPGPRDVVVKVARAGICGSDLKAYLDDGHSVGILCKGEMGVDGQFGHEMVGTVCELGSDVKTIALNDRVFVNPMTCRKTGMLSCDMSGAFSEYVLVEEAAYGYNLRKLSENTSFDEAVLTEPLGVAIHGKNAAGVKPWENVVIFGAGTIGLCALQAAIASGCRRPVIVDHHANRLALAEKLGGVGFNSAEDPDVEAFLRDHFGYVVSPFMEKNVDVDVWLDCAGTGSILNDISRMSKSGARVAVLAVYRKPVELVMGPIGSHEIQISGTLGYTQNDITESCNIIERHGSSFSSVITHRFPHEKAVEAFQTAADKSTGAIKVIIDYDV